ncbi:MAG TPA: copper-binding protein [Pyrinomonadaceae bacterium]
MLKSPTSRPGAALSALAVFVLMLASACAGRPQEGAAAGPTPQAAASPAPPIPWGTIEPPKQVGVPAGTPASQQTRAPVRTFHGTGVVRSVNLKEGWFEIDHEDIEGYMAAMRMQWKVRDVSMLNSVSAGDKVEFTLEEDNGSELVIELKKARP